MEIAIIFLEKFDGTYLFKTHFHFLVLQLAFCSESAPQAVCNLIRFFQTRLAKKAFVQFCRRLGSLGTRFSNVYHLNTATPTL